MSVDTTLDVAGQKYWSIGAYSATEQSTPVDPADTSGGIGQISVPVRNEKIVRTYMEKQVALRDGKRGNTSGAVRSISGEGAVATITADSRLAQTAVERTAKPYNGYLDGLIRYYLGLCSVTSDISIDPRIAPTRVVVPGWKGNVYDRLKALCPAYNIEMGLVGTAITFRPTRTRVTVDHRNADPSWTIDAGQLAQSVEGYHYTSRWATDLAYPGVDGRNEDVPVLQVNAGETTELEVDIEASLTSVEQPVCVDFVDRTESKSVYAVSGGDDLPVKAAQWLGGGGRIQVEIGEDTRKLKIKIIGPTGAVAEKYSPYSIAMSAGASDTYSSLRIRGTGVFFKKDLWKLPATVNPDRAPEELGVTVDNEAILSLDQLHNAMLWSASRHTRPQQTISVTSAGIAIGDWEGDASATQQFGNVAGSRILDEGCWYRIRNATVTPSQISYDGEWDTTMADAFAGKETWAMWMTRWQNKTWADFLVTPVKGLDSDGFPIVRSLYPSPTLYPAAGLYPV